MEYLRKCPLYNKDLYYKDKFKLKRAIKNNGYCKSCNLSNYNKLNPNKLQKNANWKGYENIPYNWFSKYFLRGRKTRTGSIKIEDVYNLWIKQDKKCALSKIPIN